MVYQDLGFSHTLHVLEERRREVLLGFQMVWELVLTFTVDDDMAPPRPLLVLSHVRYKASLRRTEIPEGGDPPRTLGFADRPCLLCGLYLSIEMRGDALS